MLFRFMMIIPPTQKWLSMDDDDDDDDDVFQFEFGSIDGSTPKPNGQ